VCRYLEQHAGKEPAGESEEVNVVNFEASLAEQLKQVVNDMDRVAQGRISGALQNKWNLVGVKGETRNGTYRFRMDK